MAKKVLIVDDSALMRRVLSDIIEKDGRCHVDAIARDGKSALAQIQADPNRFDVVLLDFFMPDMNADELLQLLAKTKMSAKVIIISGVIKEDAMEIIHALEHGAFDFITKPENFRLKEDRFERKILRCIELAVSGEDTTATASSEISRPVNKQTRPNSINLSNHTKKKGSVRGEKLIALACSTGGPKALHQVIPKLPKNINAPMVIVQHMPKNFTKSLADRLNEMSQVHVKEAENGEVLQKGTVYIAQGGAQLRIESTRSGYTIKETEEPARNGLKPCADIMYESLVGSGFDEIVCVVLTGMGGDGTAGIKKLNAKNNIYSITRTADTCTVYGMPKVFFESGLADEVLPLDQIADAIWKHVGVQ